MTDANQASEGELKVLLESNGWEFYEELNCFRKESKYTIPMFSTDQQTNYDELSAGNYCELKQVIQSTIRTEKLKLLAEVRGRVEQSLPDTAFLGTSIRVKENIRDGGYHDGVLDSRLATEETLTKLEAEL